MILKAFLNVITMQKGKAFLLLTREGYCRITVDVTSHTNEVWLFRGGEKLDLTLLSDLSKAID